MFSSDSEVDIFVTRCSKMYFNICMIRLFFYRIRRDHERRDAAETEINHVL